MNKLERVARAICKCVGLNPDAGQGSSCGKEIEGKMWECYIGEAQAAIDAHYAFQEAARRDAEAQEIGEADLDDPEPECQPS